MLAGEVVSLMQQRIGGQYTRTAFLAEINHAQKEILCLPDVPFLKYRGNVYLPTVDGQTVYDSLPYRVVTRVFDRQTTGSFGGRGTRAVLGAGDCDEMDYTFEYEEALSPTGTGTLYFPEEFNPGNTSTTFLLEAYKWPTTLVTENDPMSLPDHWITSLLYYAIKKRVEESSYGVDIYNSPQFKELLKSYLTRGANAPKAVSTPRPQRF